MWHRAESPERCRDESEAHASRAGRQGAGHRLRRCGSRGGRRRRAHFRLLQRRAGLHRRLPHYAGDKIYDRLVADLGAAVRSLKVGMQSEAGVEMGPLISAEQRTRVAGFVERAAAKSTSRSPRAEKCARARGFFYEPTVVAGARQTRRDRAARGVRARGFGDSLQRCR